MVNEKVSVRDFKEFETDIRGIGLVGDLLSNVDVNSLRYYVETSSLSASIDNVKSVLEKYATAPYVNLQGVSIVNIRFATAGQALAILSHYQSGGFAALVYGFSYSYIPAYQLTYFNGTWTDILLASGRVTASASAILDTVPSGAFKSVKSINLTPGCWLVNYDARFNANATGLRNSLASFTKDSTAGGFGNILINATQGNATYINDSFFVTINNDATMYLNVMHNSGVDLGVFSAFNAIRLS